MFNGPILSLQSGVKVMFSSWLETNLLSANRSHMIIQVQMENIFTTNCVPKLQVNSWSFCNEEVSYKLFVCKRDYQDPWTFVVCQGAPKTLVLMAWDCNVHKNWCQAWYTLDLDYVEAVLGLIALKFKVGVH
jgi:hypothetical protein